MEQPGKGTDADWLRAWWSYADAMRQRQGDYMDRLGLGPQTTPSRLAHTSSAATLLAYQEPRTDRAAVLIVPAPIKAAYIWDLAPDISVVNRCLTDGFQVYLLAWHRPRAQDRWMGLDEYADRTILDCLNAIKAETGRQKVLLAGHSLGGTLAAIFATLHPDLLQGLIELEGPMEFRADSGRLERAVANAPAASALTDVFGNIPGSLLGAVSSWVDPSSFGNEPLMDWMESCLLPHASKTHLQVRRWTLDETPLPQRLFEQVAEELYRENRFAAGTLVVSGRRAHPRALSMPILAVSDPRSRLIPSLSMEAYRVRGGGADVQILEYAGDVGVMLQHVGVLIGTNAHKFLWPHILAWMRRHTAIGQ